MADHEMPLTKLTLTGLSSEMLSEVFSHLPRDISSLINVALVSRKFKDLVQPFMYREIDFDWPCLNTLQYMAGISKVQKIVEFFYQNPRLCLYVQKLSLTAGCEYASNHERFPKRLVYILPNLRDLSLRPLPLYFSLPPGRNLKVVNIDLNNFSEGQPFDRCLKILPPFFHMASLQHLTISLVDMVFVDDKQFSKTLPTTSLSSIQALHLLRCQHSSLGMVSSMIGSVKALKSFVFDTYVDKCEETSRDFDRALQQHADSLEYLALEFDPSPYLPGPLIRKPIPLAGLRKLRKLHIQEVFSLGASNHGLETLLPQSLEILEMTCDTHRDNHGVYLLRFGSLFKGIRVKMPMLKRVVWWAPHVVESPHAVEFGVKNQLLVVKETCREQDIVFEACWEENIEDTPLGKEIWGHVICVT